ncbi:MAG: hydantoinase/oxoprolinase family protein [Rhodospirillaceae bacterium]|nr:hydantoinase/oxoprolinase family protein [Rhodospirillaceae bacterium]MBT5674420.1 hydantoinase/oxoprolinase family protein [Rhodospirillaceae bacterium]
MGRLASDIGGTFTDLVYFDEASGELKVEKSLTTPKDLTLGVEDTIRLAQVEPEKIDFFVHGGTTVINAITERKGAKTALVTTAGFRDVLEIARGNRPDLYNLNFEKPVPFVPRRLRFEVRERMDAAGNEVEPLTLADLDAVVERCRAENVEAVAIQLLHSYAAPAHEAACAEYLREKLPGVAITASHEITREWREYERANTAVLNAYVQPIVQRYFASLEGSLKGQGLDCPFAAMQSNGGSTSFEWAKAHPITLVESGPSAGVNGAALVGELCGEEDVIYLDIGGTTAKCSVIEGAQVQVTTEYKLEWTRINPGYPVKVPVVDIVEIGTGGGSIAWFDRVGTLKVGPVSAGSDPGPASYGQGGREPTVTDAKLLTGVLDPNYFAGGRITLDVAAAERAMQKVADGLGGTVEEAAVAVLRLADADMINALKLVSIQRGHDPRDFVLVVGGGGGAMHAATLGRELGVREIIIPLYPGYFSAWGMLATEPRRDFVQTALTRADDMTAAGVTELFAGLQAEAEEYFSAQDEVEAGQLNFEFGIDLRYLGQEHSVTVPTALDGLSVGGILHDFHIAHERAYTFRLDDTPVEFVNFRLTATARVPRPEVKPLNGDGRSEAAADKGTRSVHYGEDGRHDARILNRDLLPPGFEAEGPLVVEEPSANIIVHPGQKLRVDELGFLHIS